MHGKRPRPSSGYYHETNQAKRGRLALLATQLEDQLASGAVFTTAPFSTLYLAIAQPMLPVLYASAWSSSIGTAVAGSKEAKAPARLFPAADLERRYNEVRTDTPVDDPDFTDPAHWSHRHSFDLDPSLAPAFRHNVVAGPREVHEPEGGGPVPTPLSPKDLRTMRRDWRDLWEDAKQAELEGLVRNGTFDSRVWHYGALRPDEGRKYSVIPYTWVLRRKPTGRLKARFTAAGNFEDGFRPGAAPSPTLSYAGVRLVCMVGLSRGFNLTLLDVSQAFTCSELPADRPAVFVRAPVELNLPPGSCLRLRRSLYGLADASQIWFEKLRDSLIDFGLVQCVSDPCIFHSEDIVLGTYVDDVPTFARSPEVLAALRAHLLAAGISTTAATSGELLGWRFSFDAQARTVTFDTERYESEMLAQFGLSNTAERSTPAPAGSFLPTLSEMGADAHPDYRRALGKLSHLCRHRPVLLAAVRDLAQHAHANDGRHWSAMVHVMGYVRKTLGQRSVLRGAASVDDLQLVVASDATWAANPSTRASVIGSATFLHGCCIEARTRTLRVIAKSSTEAEIYAACEAGHRALHYRRVLRELNVPLSAPTPLEVDSRSAIALLNRYMLTSASKHMDVRRLILRQLLDEGVLSLRWVPSAGQAADVLTKNLPPAPFLRAQRLYMGEAAVGVQQPLAFAVTPMGGCWDRDDVPGYVIQPCTGDDPRYHF